MSELWDERLEDLLHFRSASDIAQYQPDPHVLKWMVEDLKCFQQRAIRYHVPDDFISLVVQGIVDGFRRLDALPREHPFWDRSNRRPTLGKLIDFSHHLLRDNPLDVSALHTAIAREILICQNFRPRYWMHLLVLGRLDISWPIYAALLSGPDDFQAHNLTRFLKAEGLCDQAITTLRELMQYEYRGISEWARGIVDACSGREEP
jgi:hypothetical protein